MTNLFEVFIVGLVLCADSFSAALALGTRPHKTSDTLMFATASGSAEALVFFLGTIAGAKIISQFDFIDHWISFTLLLFVALHMIYESVTELKQKNYITQPKKFHSFFKILIVSFATSLDAFAVGVSLGITDKPLTPFVFSIGMWAFVATIIGMGAAKRASSYVGPIFSLIGSIIILTLAFKFLIEGL